MNLVYLSPMPWAGFAQRPHHFVRWYHERFGGAVLWLDPYPTRFPILADLKRLPRRLESVVLPSWLTVLHVPALPVEPLPGSGFVHRFLWRGVADVVHRFIEKGPTRIGVGKPSCLALRLLGLFSETPSFYDHMDDFPSFYQGFSRRSMKEKTQKVLSVVTQVMTSSTALFNEVSRFHPRVGLVRNACVKGGTPLQKKTQGSVVIGYVGTVASWFDWALVCSLAEACPQATVRVVGPCFKAPPSKTPQNLERRPACTHEEAIKMMADFSLGLIPFKNNQITAGVDPIKYYEYRSLGLPVLSTTFGEMPLHQNDPGLFLIDRQKSLAEAVACGLLYNESPEQTSVFCGVNSWEARFDSARLFDGL